MKKALICGISGQDGSYLAQLLLQHGYKVYGTSRDAQMTNFNNLNRLGIREKVNLFSMSLNDFRSVLQVILKVEPDEIYNLAGQSSVWLSYEQPMETMESIAVGTLNLLEAIRFSNLPIKIYNAGSTECFGNTSGSADENTPFKPLSPYAVAKCSAFWEISMYRQSYNLFACSGILSNHESPLRPERFVTKKIIKAACSIAQGKSNKLTLGNLTVQRDWGWAPEYVHAMWLMLQQDKPEDFLIATGETNKLIDFVSTAFSYFALNWDDYVTFDNSLLRPTDLTVGKMNPKKAKEKLGWISKYKMKDVIRMMIESEMGDKTKND